MLYFEWKEEDALKYAKEEGYENGFKAGFEDGEKKERENNIRALRDVLPAETIAEKFKLSKEYVYEVLKQDMCVCEPTVEYKATRK